MLSGIDQEIGGIGVRVTFPMVKKKAPTLAGAFVHATVSRLLGDLQTVARPLTLGGASSKNVPGGDHLDPQRPVALVEGGRFSLAQRIEAALLGAGVRRGEARQFEHHP